MKKIITFSLMAISAVTVFISCKKNSTDNTPAQAYKCSTCVSASEALATNNASSKGIYEGIVLGSSGTIKFDILNSGTTITAIMVIDGITVNLTASVAWVSGQAYIAPFTGTLNGSPVTINFSVSFNGSTPVINSSNIPGHPSAQFTLLKETSVALIEAFEGTYSNTNSNNTIVETGTFNILVSRGLGTWTGASRITNTTYNSPDDGTVSSTGVMTQTGGGVVGNLIGDVMSGKFIDQGITTTWTGKRTL